MSAHEEAAKRLRLASRAICGSPAPVPAPRAVAMAKDLALVLEEYERGRRVEDAVVTFLEWALRCRKYVPDNRIVWTDWENHKYESIPDRFDETLAALAAEISHRVECVDGKWIAKLGGEGE